MSVAGQVVTTISKPPWTESGILVSSNSNRLGPGKLRALGKSTATVEYFYSHAESHTCNDSSPNNAGLRKSRNVRSIS